MTVLVLFESGHLSNGDIIAAVPISKDLAYDSAAIRDINDLAQYFCQTVEVVEVLDKTISTPEEAYQFIRDVNPCEDSEDS